MHSVLDSRFLLRVLLPKLQHVANNFSSVVLRFDASEVQWDRPGATGVAMRLDAETASHHGVYVVGGEDQVYTFLQKPALATI